MSVERYEEGIGFSASLLQLKWDLLDQRIAGLLQPGEDINVFINFESIMENITVQRPMTSTLAYYKQDVTLEMESAILNLVAHYRAYFRKLRCKPKIYIYYTDLKNTEPQQMTTYAKYYREFYKNQFLQNPQFRAMGELLVETVIPEIKLILSYVQGCYFLSSSTFDGSIIPLIIGNIEGGVKNVILSSDSFDTLYLFHEMYRMFYIRRRYKYSNIACDMDEVLQYIFKNESVFDITLFRQPMYYRLLLAVIGSKTRNINGGYGFGVGKLLSLLKAGIDTGNILKTYSSIDSIIDLFPSKQRTDIKEAFQCMNLDTQYSLLSDADIGGIKDQLIDKYDPSVSELNDKRFLQYPINLQALLN